MSDAAPVFMCPCGCGVVNEAAADRIADLEDHVRDLEQLVDRKDAAIHDLEVDLRVKRAQVSKAKSDANKRREMSPLAPQAEEVFEYWKRHLAPQAREFNGARFDAVVARLRAGFTIEEIKQGIDGCAYKPYVRDGAGRQKTGKPSEKNVELELICRSEPHLRRFMAYAEEERMEQLGLEAQADDTGSILSADALAAMRRRLDTPGKLARLTELKGWTSKAIHSLELGLDEGRVVFPVRDETGKVVGLVKYAPNPEKRRGPKSLAEGERNLFPSPESIEDRICWLVEGEPDAVSMRTMGIPAVGLPGTGKWREEWAKRFEKFEHVFICLDADKAGRDAAEARKAAIGKVTRATIIELDKDRDDGYDVGDVLKEHGANAAFVLHGKAKQTTTVMPMPQRATDTPIEKVLAGLAANSCNVKQKGPSTWQAQCPRVENHKHADRTPSLSLSVNVKGDVLIHCHAGCQVGHILATLQLSWQDIFGQEAS